MESESAKLLPLDFRFHPTEEEDRSVVESESAKLLPRDLRFHPTDEELVWYYLKRKVCGKPLPWDIITEIDIYKYEPWDLPGRSKLKSRDLEWYFFSVVERYGNSKGRNRATEKGYWKSTGKDREVDHGSRTVGIRKTLVYYRGRAPHGQRTDWVMHEYRLMDEELKKTGVVHDAFVLCRIHKKSRSRSFIEENEVAFAPGEMAAEEVVGGNEASDEADDFERFLMKSEQSMSDCLDLGLDSNSKAKGQAWDGEKDFDLFINELLKKLNRKKDIVCLILSYPPFNSMTREKYKGWIQDVLNINFRPVHRKETNFLELSSTITRLLGHPIPDIKAYVPLELIDKMRKGNLGDGIATLQVLNLVTDFAIRQIIQDTNFQRITISGQDGGRLMTRLKNLPQIREIFDIVIHVKASCCHSIGDVEYKIGRELGLSMCNKQEVDEFLRSKNFLILVEDIRYLWIDPYDMGINWWNKEKIQKIVYGNEGQAFNVDLDIRMEDHLLSWELFCRNVGVVVHFSSIQRLAVHVLKQCCGHLLATILMARALKGVMNVRIWEYASYVLSLGPTSEMEDKILFNALSFIVRHLGTTTGCLTYCASYLEREGMKKVDLIERWMKGALIRTLDDGAKIIHYLVNAFLLENFESGESVRMRDDIRKELVNLFKADMKPVLYRLAGRGLTESPKDGAWKEANEMHLMHNEICKLPVNPNCPKLSALFLQVNHRLRVIPPLFFECMSLLQILNLSYTRLRFLPLSIFKLVRLQKFFLRGCELFMELPGEVGELHQLEVLDLEGTEIKNLPITVGKLTNLRCLKVSFYGHNNDGRKNIQSNGIITQNVISSLIQLEELSIDVNPDDKRWNVTVKDIVREVHSLNRLEALKLHLPEVVLLNELRNGESPMNLSLMHFRFIVGSHLKRIISRVPHESIVKFENEERCLKYVNGESVPTEIKEVLRYATAFFLDRHLTVTSLLEFGITNMKNLKFCVLGECNEVRTIVDADVGDAALGSLECLNLHYMKKLRSIWKGPPSPNSLSNLKSLALHTCPQLTTIFTLDLLANLNNLQELIVEDCPEINSIVTHEIPTEDLWSVKGYLPNLKKISLHYMPKLASISGGLQIAPRLEWMSFYNCLNLKTLSEKDVSSNNLKAIIGEEEWWKSLNWNMPKWFQPPNLDSIFIPIESDRDLVTQLAEISDQLQAQKQERKPSQQSGPADSGQSKLKAEASSLALPLQY